MPAVSSLDFCLWTILPSPIRAFAIAIMASLTILVDSKMRDTMDVITSNAPVSLAFIRGLDVGQIWALGTIIAVFLTVYVHS